MLRSNSKSFLLITGLMSSLVSLNVFADQATVFDVHGLPVVVTTVPEPKEVIEVPSGYVNCFMVPAGWNYKNVWVAEHKVCQYKPSDGGAVQGVAWVDSYWACLETKAGTEPTQANCINWEWQPGHWVKSLEVY